MSDAPGEYWEDLDMIDGSYDPHDDKRRQVTPAIRIANLITAVIAIILLMVCWYILT